MYQMYAYQRKYSFHNRQARVNGVTLIYPKAKEDIDELSFVADDVNVHIKFVDMSQPEKSIEKSLANFLM
jgi:5-methylcytosine-specific restriction endonuclease McrBC regulatory subunit McrC